MNKHTPGPWAIGKLREETPKAIIDPTFEPNYVDVDPTDPMEPSIIARCYGPRRKENARLIAAAPELLEWTEVLFAAIHSGQLTLAKNADILKLRNTIRKAKGE